MPSRHVPLIIRGKIIEATEIEFGGRGGGTSFKAADVGNYLDQLILPSPSLLGDMYSLSFEEILDYLDELGNRLRFSHNGHVQQAFELSVLTSGLTESILRHNYENYGSSFRRNFVRGFVESSIGIDHLEGWVEKKNQMGAHAYVRAIGARAVHVVAGNVPTVSAMTVMRNAVLRSDAIIKTPSNDPLTAASIARTMIEMAPDHPLTRHISVAYWKGGDAAIEDRLYQPRNIDKIIAWGGFASINHIKKYIQPGIDLITLDPKLSSTIIGKDAFTDETTMLAVAERLAIDIGNNNQEACVNARVIYIETGTEQTGIGTANRFGKMVYDSMQTLPARMSTPARRLNAELAEEISTLKIMGDSCWVIGGGAEGAILVSQTDEPVEFARLLANRVANIVPIDTLDTAVQSVNAYTQTIGIYPDSLKPRLRDRLAFHGAQRLVSLGYSARMSCVGPHDGIEPLRRMAKWVVDEDFDPRQVPLANYENDRILEKEIQQ